MSGIRAWWSSMMTLIRISGRKKMIFQRRSIWKWAGGSRFLSNATAWTGDLLAGSLEITGKRAVCHRAAYRCDALFSLCGYSRNSPLTAGSGGAGTLHPCNVQTGCQRPDDPLGPGHNHRHSMFYLAEGDYSLFNTCNSWISKALQAAGLPIKTALFAGGVMSQAALWPDDTGACRGRAVAAQDQSVRAYCTVLELPPSGRGQGEGECASLT